MKKNPLEKVAKIKVIKYFQVFQVFQSSNALNTFLSSSSSLKPSKSTLFSQFSQSIPSQFPQAETQTRRCLLQLQVLVLHGPFFEILQLHRIKRRLLSGATFKSVIIGQQCRLDNFHPQSRGFNSTFIKVFHSLTCKWTRIE